MVRNSNAPHGAWLKNGNPACDLNALPKCNATAKTTGKQCQQPAMKNGKCRFHGGKSTGPRTPEGLRKSQRANWKHGRYSAEAKQDQRMIRRLVRESREMIKRLDEKI